MSLESYNTCKRKLIAQVWLAAGKDEYTYLPQFQMLTLDKAVEVFRDVIEPECDIWVIHDDDSGISGFMALKDSYIDRLYVHPGSQRRGVGQQLMDHAKTLCPDGLTLHTHQQNLRACAFYEKNGFAAVEFGLSPPPESVPDVLYQWQGDANPQEGP